MVQLPDLTICIPIGPGHEETAERAKESVKAQTVEVIGHAFYDEHGDGAGYARNQLLERVETPYVTFLDADDWIEPTFAEVMLSAAYDALEDSKYVYSAWWEVYPANEERIPLPRKCYCFEDGNWWNVHLINAVIPTHWAREIAFNEDLPGMEDTDFFHRLHEAGYCGKGLDVPLVHYTSDGNRSKAFRQRSDYLTIKEALGTRYHKDVMSCCGEAVPNTGPYNDKQAGDMLYAVQGNAFMVYVGRSTQRIYKSDGYGQLMWVNPGDAAMDPSRFRIVEQPSTTFTDLAPQLNDTLKRRTNGVSVPGSANGKKPGGKITPSKLAGLAGFKRDE